jgi:RecJ-like exonuclease
MAKCSMCKGSKECKGCDGDGTLMTGSKCSSCNGTGVVLTASARARSDMTRDRQRSVLSILGASAKSFR